ncbi:hypothetical protein DW906_04515, partial [Coprobacillus sp. AM42-12AC]
MTKRRFRNFFTFKKNKKKKRIKKTIYIV